MHEMQFANYPCIFMNIISEQTQCVDLDTKTILNLIKIKVAATNQIMMKCQSWRIS